MLRLDRHRRLLQGHADRALELSRHQKRVWVRGATGAGRRLLVDLLRAEGAIAVVDIPSLRNFDAVFHALLQAAAATGEPHFGELARDPYLGPDHGPREEATLLAARAREVARRLVAAGKTLVVLIPDTWNVEGVADAGAKVRATRARALLGGLIQARDLPIIVATPSGFSESAWRQEAPPIIELEHPKVGPDDILPDTLPEPYRSAAERVAMYLRTKKLVAAPVDVRIAVGALVLGESESQLRRFEGLISLLTDRLSRLPSLGLAVARFFAARRPLPLETVKQVSRVDDEHLPLLSQCLGYGDSEVRVSARVRFEVMDHLPPGRPGSPRSIAIEEAHRELAEHFRASDGATALGELQPLRVVSWLEKIHHLAHGGVTTQEEWEKQDLAARELYWERARYLSLELKDYGRAAYLYQGCIAKFGGDSYSFHYLAFNLDRAGQDLRQVRTYFDAAIRLDPENPWWNARLVTFLIAHGTVDEARDAWRAAIDNVDPEAVRLRESPWLSMHMHRWVTRRWLALGYVADARAVFDEIPRGWISQERALQLLELELEDAEEALLLGDSVYPATVPIKDRWREPRVLPGRNASGAARVRWFPGRVVTAASDGVVIVRVEPETRELRELTVTPHEWRQAAGEPPEDAVGFIEIGEYADGTIQVRRCSEPPVFRADDDYEHVLTRLRS